MADDKASDQQDEPKNGAGGKIETAVKFLQNPRVRETPLAQRKAFLAKKGLTPEEITIALKQSGTSDQDIEAGIPPSSRAHFQNGGISTVNTIHYPTRWRDFFIVAVIGGGLGYTLVHLVKTYILPYFLESKDESHEKIDQLQSSVTELKETFSETVCGIQETLDSVQKLLQDQQQKVQALSLNLSTSQSLLTSGLTDSYSLSEVKSELSSLKGLLLNRRQFPSPVVQSTPGIPTWQRSDASAPGTTAVAAAAAANTETIVGDQDANPFGGTPSLKLVQNGAISKDDPGSSSGTLELQDTLDNDENQDGDHPVDTSDTSFSTMSSDVGSPNLSLSGLKESVSETYVKVSTD